MWSLRSGVVHFAPEVPTVAEAGVPIRLIDVIWGIYGPPHMPKNVVARLSQELNLITQDVQVRAQLARQGFEAEGSTPEQLADFVADQLRVWRQITQESGIALE